MCTFPFLQAMATQTFLCYTMHSTMNKSIAKRIIRYCERGFTFLEPIRFDDAYYHGIMSDDSCVEQPQITREILNQDEEFETVTITYYPRSLPLPNVDTYRIQEQFIQRICHDTQ